MSETYCGKSCVSCEHNEAQQCPGCKEGPGKSMTGTCEIARCCRMKGHQICESCTLSTNCSKFRSRHREAERRIKKAETDAVFLAQAKQKASVLGKWLSILFWLIVPSTIASILQEFDSIAWIGHIAEAVLKLFSAIILIRLGTIDKQFSAAGIMSIFVSLSVLLPELIENEDLSAFLLVLSALLSIVAVYQEFSALAVSMEDISFSLGQDWYRLRKHFMICYAVLAGCSICVWLGIPLLTGIAAIAVAAAGIAGIVLSIQQLIALYSSAAACRKFPS